MALTFRDCRECGESHALRSDGRMSVHSTATGTRCTEPEAVAAPPETNRTRAPRRVDSPHHQVDPELQAAFDVSDARRRREDDRGPKSLDRRIYATSDVHTVRGGNPGGGKRR